MLSPMMQCAGRIRVKDCPFGAPDGTANQFQLVDRHGHAVTKDVRIQSIHQTDWQGRVELSNQPRTNYVPNSGQDGVSPFSAFRGTIQTGVSGVRPGTTSAITFTCDGNTDPLVAGVATIGSAIAGRTFTYSVWLRTDDPNVAAYGGLQLFLYTTPQTSITSLIVQPTSEWQPFPVTLAVKPDDTNLNMTFRVDVPVNNHPLAGVHASIDLPMVSDGPMPGAYIPTTDSPVTVTDYTHDGQGGITTGQVPAADATLDWTGSARRAA